jgi:ABC-2 type transporter.
MTKFFGLIKWSLIRHKYILPIFSVLQIVLALAMVYGLSLFIYEIDEISSIYLASGTISIGIISVGCVLCAQIVAESKQNGIFNYQRTLPTSRFNIIIADIVIWGGAALPGVIASYIATLFRFDIESNITFGAILLILLFLITMISIGFSIAYYFKPNMVGMVTQVIMIVSLLFSPITFPANRLPESIVNVYNFFPFVPATNLLRASLFGLGEFRFINLLTVVIWCLACFMFSLYTLSKRD